MFIFKTKHIQKLKYFMFFTIIFIIFSTSYTNGFSEENNNVSSDKNIQVLFISSYSPSNTSVLKQLEGIRETLDGSVTLESEFLNSNIINDNKNDALFYDILNYHISSYKNNFDIVIVGDDEALDLVLKYKNVLFPNTPIIFEGIENKFIAENAAMDPIITGSIEKLNFENNIHTALNLYPDAKNIIAVSDNTLTGIGDREQFYAEQEQFSNIIFKDINSSELNEEEFVSALSKLNNDSILFYLNMNETIDKKQYSDYEVCKLITENTTIPTFCLTDLNIGNGYFGGAVLSSKQSGIIAANTVNSIINGQNISEIPLLENSSSKYKFDFKVMKKYHINSSSLPSNSIYVNYEKSFREKYGKLLAIGSILIMILLLLIQFVIKWFESRMKNRKLEISTSTLKEALKISERNGIAKSEYLNCVSNEIKQPMSTLISLINRTKKELNDSEKTKQNINAIDDTARTLFNSVNELLNISNLDIQTLEINHEPFKLSRILNDLRQTFSYLCNERNITFSENRYDITENNYYGDSYKLGLLLSNLLTNALKYTENGNTIDLKSTQKPSGDKNYAILEFVVSDTGIGMSKDKLDKVFSNNYNNDSAQNGSGLGLSMTKKYISMMNGNISAISTEGEGTSITVTIPLEICEKDGKQVRVYKSPEEYNFSGKTILIAEDNELNLAILDDVLKTVNFKTMIAKNGREAVYTFNKAQYKDIDVILMDVDMPIMDGYEAANTIRKSKHANSSTIPIIAMSQDVYEDDVEKILNNGFNSHVIKPVDADELYYTLEKYLEMSEET